MQWAAPPQQAPNETGFSVGPGSAPRSQAPVALDVSGSKHGTQRRSAAQPSVRSWYARRATSGRHDGRQRPSAPYASVTHDGGTYASPAWAASDGTHRAPSF